MPWTLSPYSTFCCTVNQGNSACSWKTMPISGGVSTTARPPTRIFPAVGVTNPARQLSSVVLPQPEGPSRQTNSEGAISSVMPARTSTIVPSGAGSATSTESKPMRGGRVSGVTTPILRRRGPVRRMRGGARSVTTADRAPRPVYIAMRIMSAHDDDVEARVDAIVEAFRQHDGDHVERKMRRKGNASKCAVDGRDESGAVRRFSRDGGGAFRDIRFVEEHIDVALNRVAIVVRGVLNLLDTKRRIHFKRPVRLHIHHGKHRPLTFQRGDLIP